MRLHIARKKLASGFSLVEVALALGIAGFCLVSLFGLVPLGVDTAQVAADQAVASSILTHVLADLRATPALPVGSAAGTPSKSSEYGLTIPDSTPRSGLTTPVFLYFGDTSQYFSFPTSGGAPVAAASSARYRLTIQYLPTDGGVRAATGVSLQISWPPQVDPTKVDPSQPQTGRLTGRVQIFAALDRN